MTPGGIAFNASAVETIGTRSGLSVVASVHSDQMSFHWTGSNDFDALSVSILPR